MRARRFISFQGLVPIAILAAGLTASVYAGIELNRAEREAYREAGQNALGDYTSHLTSGLRSHVRALERLAQSWAARPGATLTQQTQEAAALVADLPGLLAVAALNPELDLEWMESRLDPIAERDLIFPQGERQAAAGPFDLTDTPTLVTKTIDLDAEQKALRVYVPVLTPSGLGGLVAAVIVLDPIFEMARLPSPDDAVEFAIFEDWLPIRGDAAVLDLLESEEQGFAPNTFVSTLSFFGNDWTLVLRPRQTVFFGNVHLMPLLVLVFGCLTTLAVAAGAIAVTVAGRQMALNGRATRAAGDLSQRLKEAEDRYTLVAEGARVGLWDWNIRANRLYWTGRINAMLGISTPLLAPKSEDFERALHPDDRGRVADALRDHLAEGVPFDLSFRMRCGADPYKSFHVRGHAVRDAEGRPVRMGGSLDDLSLSAPGPQRFGLPDLVDLIPVRIMVKDERNRILHANRQAAESLGLGESDGEGLSVRTLFPDQAEVWHEADLKVFDTEEPSFGVIEPDASRNGPDRWLRTDRILHTDPTTGQQVIIVSSSDATAEHRAQRALRFREERHNLVLRGSGAAFWDYDVRQETMYWSPRLYEIMGRDPETFQPSLKSLQDLLHPDDRERVQNAREAHLDSREPYDIEFRSRRADGTYAWLHSRGQAIWDQDGTPVRMLGSVHDITARKKRNAERVFIREMSDDGLWDWYLAKDFQLCSPRFWQMLGYEPDEKKDHPSEWKALALPEDLEAFEDMLRRHVETKGAEKISLEMRYRHKDGSVVTILSRGQVIEWAADGKPLRLVATHTDLTSMRRTEAALRLSDRRFQTAVQGMSVGVFDWIDVNADDIWWSPLFFDLLGYESGEIKPAVSTFRSLIHPEDVDPTFEALDAHLAGKAPFRVECRLKHKQLGYRWFLGSAQAIWDEDGKPVRMIGSIMDIHERKTAELTKSEFVSTVSHELRSPMTSVMGAVGLIRSGRLGAMPPKVQELLDIAQANGDRLVQIINDILDMDKIEAGQLDFHMVSQSLHDLLQAAVREAEGLALERDVAVTLDLVGADVLVEVDADRFAQVMANLLSNAIKFSSPGDVVTVSTRNMGDQARILVRDRGPGIPAQYRPLVFDKFTQADPSDARRTGGTGLGMSIAKAIVEKFNGTIGFETAMGKGTTFYFDLPKQVPAVRAEAGDLAPSGPLFRATPGLNRILIVENDIGIVRVLEQLIGDVGEVCAVGTRTAARRVIAGERPDLVIMEPLLPDGDGLEDAVTLFDGCEGKAPHLLVYSTQVPGERRLPTGAKVLVKARSSNQDVRDVVCAVLGWPRDADLETKAPATRQQPA